MILSINKSFSHRPFVVVITGLAITLTCFRSAPTSVSGAVLWSNSCLNKCYDPSTEIKLKKWELNVTPDLFIRFRRTYQSGRQDYYSFSIKTFSDIVYLGNASTGLLQLKTEADNIIQQTYNDPKGDTDDMVQSLNIPVKNMPPERLDSLLTALQFLKNAK